MTKDESSHSLHFTIMRWPRACIACGNDVPEDSRGVYRLFEYTEPDEKQYTKKAPAKLYVCMYCIAEIQYACTVPSEDPDGHSESVERLKSSLFDEFVELDDEGITIAEGPFLDKLLGMNPEASPHTKSNPLFEMRERMPKDSVISNRYDLPTLIAADAATDASASGQFLEPGEIDPAVAGGTRGLKDQIDGDPLNYALWMELAIAYAEEGRCYWARDSLVRARDLAGDVSSIADALEKCREICGSVIDEDIDSW